MMNNENKRTSYFGYPRNLCNSCSLISPSFPFSYNITLIYYFAKYKKKQQMTGLLERHLYKKIVDGILTKQGLGL
jgi:hypothetical protein